MIILIHYYYEVTKGRQGGLQISKTMGCDSGDSQK